MIFTLWIHLLSGLLQLIPNENWVYRLPPALFNLSLTASIVILAVLLVRLLLRKAPRVYSYALWAVVAFRLICPVSFSSDFSLLGILDAPAIEAGQVEYVPVTIVHDPNPSVDLILPEITDAVNEQLPTEWEQAADPLEWPASLATHIWITGVGIMLLWALISFFNLRHKLRTAVLLEGNVFQSEHVGSPFILGLFRPKIYIPFGLDDITLKYALAHEKYHIKRLDHIVKVFSFAILVIHWFNPLCWLAFHLMSKDMEMSCDEKVLSQDNNVKTEYSTVLLSFAANRRFPSPSPLAFGETSAKRRIKNALKWKRPKVWVTVLAAVLCIAIIAACAANPKEETSNQDESPYEWTSTAQVDDLLSIKIRPLGTDVNYSINLSSDERCNELFDILNNIPSDSIYPGRGIPAQLSVTIVQQSQTVYLNYGGDMVEISLLGASTDKIWEIHDDALNAFMDDCLSYAQSIYDEYIDDKVSTSEGLSLSLLSATQKGAASTLTLKLENLSGHAVSYGRAWGIECLTDPSWQDAPHSYTTELILLADGEAEEYTVERELPPGTYRIWKQVTLGTIDPLNRIDEFEECSVSAFFTIGETVSQATAADQVQWEYAPALSSVYPAFPININFYHVEATCSAGQLINREAGTKGSSMTYTFKNTLYWSPTTSDSINVPSATIEFTAHNAGDDRVYSGTIFIEQTASDSDSVFIYTARLLAGGELVLGRDIGGSAVGKVSRIPVHDLSADGKIELAAWRLPYYRFKTNSTKIYLEFDRSEEPIEIQLYATDAEGPLLHFSTASKNLASCSFSNLTSAREYYFAAQCDSNTLFTIHD